MWIKWFRKDFIVFGISELSQCLLVIKVSGEDDSGAPLICRAYLDIRIIFKVA